LLIADETGIYPKNLGLKVSSLDLPNCHTIVKVDAKEPRQCFDDLMGLRIWIQVLGDFWEWVTRVLGKWSASTTMSFRRSNEVWALGGAGELASGDEIAGIYHELSIPKADQSTVLHFTNHFYGQSKIFSHFLVSVRVHSSPSLIEI
jgi:hypothetical protein